MKTKTILAVVFLAATTSSYFAQDRTAQDSDAQREKKNEKKDVFSGPQPGEKLPEFTMKYAFGDNEGKEFDLVKIADGKPVVIIFVHERSRPAFGLANIVMRFCNDEKGKLTRGICFLTADPTETQTWLGRIKNYFPGGTPVGISFDGAEGPGSYGLNRNVALTILIGKENKVSANYALVQPSAKADGPKILKSIAAAIGAEQEPNLEKYLPRQRGDARKMRNNPEFNKLLRKLLEKDASEEQIGKAIQSMDALVKDKRGLQSQLGQLAQRWVQNDRVDTIGNEKQQEQIKKWAKEFAAGTPPRNQPDAKLTGMLRSLIQKTNTDEQVDKIAKSIEEYIEKNAEAKAQVARISKTIAGSDRLTNYGTPHAQEILKKWAAKYNPKK